MRTMVFEHVTEESRARKAAKQNLCERKVFCILTVKVNGFLDCENGVEENHHTNICFLLVNCFL